MDFRTAAEGQISGNAGTAGAQASNCASSNSAASTSVRGRTGALAAAVLLGLVLSALPSWSGEARALEISRSIFQGQDGRAQPQLRPGAEVEMRSQRWQVSQAIQLRVESPDPEIKALLRFRPLDPKAGTLTLTLVLFNPRKRFDYQHQQQSMVMAGGSLRPRQRLELGQGLVTDLGGAIGEVAEILVQEDGTRELRLMLRGGVLVLRVIPFEEGGDPSGAPLPYFERERLSFLNYDLLAGGFEENGYGELRLFEDFALLGNVIADGSESVILARGVLRQQLVRWRRVAISVEGGPALFTLDPEDPSEEDDGELTLVAGATLTFRYGDWGVAAHVSSVNGPALAMLLAGWQFSSSFGAFLEWQSFQGFSDFGVGLSLLF